MKKQLLLYRTIEEFDQYDSKIRDSKTWFLVHLSRRLKCTIVIMRCPSSVVRRPSSLTFHIFDFFSETT